MSADSADDAWAVGWRSSDGLEKTLIEHWDGRTWATVPSPNRSPLHVDALSDVAAISPTDAWAVGAYRAPAGYRTLTLHWDGRRWDHVPSPSGHHFSNLRSISAVGSDDIWAVGSITKHYGQWYRGLIENWDGTSWSIVDTTTPRRRNGGFDTVSVVSRDDVWASAGGGSSPYSIYHYDGEWTQQDLRGLQVSGRDISMDAASDGWAVGGGTLHWDGVQWTWVAPPFDLNDIRAVSAVSPTDAWLAGAGTEFGHWDGTRWTRVPGAPADIFSLDARTADDVWAAGYYDDQARIEHWDGTSWTVSQ